MNASAPTTVSTVNELVGGSTDFDVIIVGAGLSGIGAAYRLQEENPGIRYAVLEARDDLGGTWDLFRYPGIRSDSDMYTLAYPFEPWTHPDAIADGGEILAYLRSTSDKYGITQNIRFRQRVTSANWDSTDGRWSVTVDTPDGPATYTAAFVYACSGYYNYDEPYQADISGIEHFESDVIHPQHWPNDVPIPGRRVVIIGSGATAVSLAPALVKQGAQVVMLQRTPTFLLSQPRRDPINTFLTGRVSDARRHRILRAKNMRAQSILYKVAQGAPKVTRKILDRGVRLGAGAEHVKSFTPPYDPWDQRMCIVPNGDFFKALKAGDIDVVTDVIEHVEADGIRTKTGRFIPADVIVTATGLAVQVLGGATVSVDGEPVDLSQRLIYRGCMLEGVPNAAICIGYINASWGLRSDMSNRFVARMVSHLRSGENNVVTPVPPVGLDRRPLLEMDSGYLRRAADMLPRRSSQVPWTMRQDCIAEEKEMRQPNLTEELTFSRTKQEVSA